MAVPIGLQSGPHPLTDAGVKAAVLYKSPGAYVLGKRGDDGVFYIDYAGRSDEDVADRLSKHTPSTTRSSGSGTTLRRKQHTLKNVGYVRLSGHQRISFIRLSRKTPVGLS